MLFSIVILLVGYFKLKAKSLEIKSKSFMLSTRKAIFLNQPTQKTVIQWVLENNSCFFFEQITEI